MSLEALTSMPEKLAAGSTLKVLRSYSDYSASDGWTVTFYFLGPSSFDKAADAEGSDHLLTLDATSTAALVVGTYNYQARAEKSGEVAVVESGSIEVTADFSTATGASDQRSFNKKALDAIRAVLANKASSDELSYQIAGRQVQHFTWQELMDAESVFSARYKAELNKERRAAGIPTGTGRVRPLFR